MKPSKILVPIDFSSFSDYAADYAIFLAKKYKSKITFLHAVVLYETDVDEEMHIQQLETIIDQKEEHSIDLLDQHNKKYAGIVDIDAVSIRGISAANTILEYLDKHPHDLIVMGTHGRTGFKKWIYGSVAEKVLRFSHVPVLTLHSPVKDIKLKKIVVPIDFSENSRTGCKEAKKLAEDFGAQLHLINVIEQQVHPSFHVVGIESVYAFNPDIKEISSNKLAEFCHKQGLNAKYTVVEGVAHQVITDYAKNIAADMIVMSTRGFTGLDHLLIGSTTEHVIRIAQCPVLTVGRNPSE